MPAEGVDDLAEAPFVDGGVEDGDGFGEGDGDVDAATGFHLFRVPRLVGHAICHAP